MDWKQDNVNLNTVQGAATFSTKIVAQAAGEPSWEYG